MARRRSPIRRDSLSNVNYNNFNPTDFGYGSKPKGTKPTISSKDSMADTFLELFVKISNLYLNFNLKYRIMIYLAVLFGVSIVSDHIPKSYLSQSNHFLNQYFVKLGWGWTLIATIPFVVMTSYTYCCSDRVKVGKHLLRLGIATFFWLFWTNVFHYIESVYGRCSDTKTRVKSKCLGVGERWSGFDLSGHSFILIYSVLLMIEESKPIQGWTSIQSSIDAERHSRANKEKSGKSLQNLTDPELDSVEKNYKDFRRLVCFNAIGIAILTLIWDLMILTTAMYYHSMIEKVASGLISIATWYVTYRLWYKSIGVPSVPGDGKLKYYERKETTQTNGGVLKTKK